MELADLNSIITVFLSSLALFIISVNAWFWHKEN